MVNRPYGFIYITTNLVNGKRYIGQKKIDGKHKYYLGSGVLLKNAITKYGKENFKRDIISFADTFEELNKQEKELISFFNATSSENFYNIEEGGWSYPLSEHTKELISKNHAHLKGKDSPMYGRKMSDETKRKLSESLKGKAPPNKGKPMSESHKEKLKEAWKHREVTVSNHAPIMCVETGDKFFSVADASRQLGLTYGSIFAVVSGRRNSLFGKHYVYLEESEVLNYGSCVC